MGRTIQGGFGGRNYDEDQHRQQPTGNFSGQQQQQQILDLQQMMKL
jgi:hypothetical protein